MLFLLLLLSVPPDGSVVYWQNGQYNRIIQKQTGSDLTHAAIVLNGFVYEAVPPSVRKVPWADYVKEMEAKAKKPGMKRRGFTWFVTSPQVAYTTECAAMLEYAETQLGRPYDIRGWRRGEEVEGIFCSQLVSDILGAGGRYVSAGVKESPGSLHTKLKESYNAN